MRKPKSCPSTEPSKPVWDINNILDCYAEAYSASTNKGGHKKFYDNLEKAYPGLDLSKERIFGGLK